MRHFERFLEPGPVRESFNPWAEIVSSERIHAKPSLDMTKYKPFLDPIDACMDDQAKGSSDGEGRGKRTACDVLDGHVDGRRKSA